MVSKSSRHSLI